MNKIVLALVCAVAAPAFAQQFELPRLSPFAKAVQTVGLTDITVDYSSPGVRGRKIWGGLVPYGEVWRAGANQSTKVTFSKDVSIGGTAVPAGSYAFFVLPNAKGNWTVIFSKDVQQFGAFSYKKEADLLRIDVKPQVIPERERLAYSFPEFGTDTATLALDWEKVRIAVPIKLGTTQQVAAMIKNLEENPQSQFTSAARYELEQTKDYDAGLRLVDKSLAMKENWLNVWTKAQLLAAKGDKKGALALAQKANELGAQNPQGFFFAGEVKKALEDWKK
jgi:hypothetical protein